jgi:hypothetical protein
VVPLASFAAVRTLTLQQRLDHSVWCVARYGVSRKAASLGFVMASAGIVACAAVLLVVAGLAVVYAGREGFLADAWPSIWITALGAASYALWFLAGSAWGRGGRGRWWPFVLDWIFGAGSGAAALLWPRAAVRHLLGSGELMSMSQAQSCALLVVVSAVLLALVTLRIRD